MILRLLCIAIASLTLPLPVHAMSKKSELTVRFHAEANRNDSEAFAIPVNLIYQRRQAYVSRVPDFSEKHIERIQPFVAKDGSWGCVFKLNPQGRIRLETMSGEIRGSALVVFIGTKMGQRQVADLMIDRPVTDGIISIPRGLAPLEILLLKKQFKIIGEKEPKGWGEKPRNPVEKLPGGQAQPQPAKPSILEPLTSPAPARRGPSPEPALPRQQD
jgi:hypothetical protein